MSKQEVIEILERKLATTILNDGVIVKLNYEVVINILLLLKRG